MIFEIYLIHLNLVSTSFNSYFGSNALKIANKYTSYDPNYNYLILNSEFAMDSDLNGFIINAVKPGNVNLSVIQYIDLIYFYLI